MPNTITLNSQVLAPTTINLTITKVGEQMRMADGTLRFFYRSSKRSWELSWENAPLSIIGGAYAAYNVNTTTTLIDEFGASWNVLIVGEFSQELSAESIGVDGTFYYNASFTVEQI